MNKSFLFLFSFIILSSFCFAIDYPMININDCYSNITVNVIPTMIIDSGEYSVKDCTNLSNNTWQCNCGTPIILSVLPNTINNYTLVATYTSVSYTPEVQVASTGGGGGGGGGYYPTIYHNDTNTSTNQSNNNVYIENKTIPTVPVIQIVPTNVSTNLYQNTAVVGNTTSSNSTLPKEENRSGIFASIGNFFRMIWKFLTRPW